MLTVLDPSCTVSQLLRKSGVPAASSAREPLLSGKRRDHLAKPVLSKTVAVAGRQVEAWNDELFSKLREKHGIQDNFLNAQREKSVDLTIPREETKLGKGGETQYLSKDSNYVIKSIQGDDHKSLLVRAEAYVHRLLAGDSLLVPIYLHFRDPETHKSYIVMGNLTPEKIIWDEKYDLKGCADDKTLVKDGKMIKPVRRRFYRADMWLHCMWTSKRWNYYEGKVHARSRHFDFPTKQRDEIVRLIQADAEWLMQQGLMDYSLFVAIRRMPSRSPRTSPAETSSQVGRKFAMWDGESSVLVTLGIIDFLQPWTAPKKVAQCIKSLEFNKATIPPPAYGARFKRHFAERLRGDDRLRPESVKAVLDAALGKAGT